MSARALRELRQAVLDHPAALIGLREPPADLLFGYVSALTDAIDELEGRSQSAWRDFLASKGYGARLEYRVMMDFHDGFASRVAYLKNLYGAFDTWCREHAPAGATSDAQADALESALLRVRSIASSDAPSRIEDVAAVADAALRREPWPPTDELRERVDELETAIREHRDSTDATGHDRREADDALYAVLGSKVVE